MHQMPVLSVTMSLRVRNMGSLFSCKCNENGTT